MSSFLAEYVKRWKRLLLTLSMGVLGVNSELLPKRGGLVRLLDLVFYIFDVLFIPEFYYYTLILIRRRLRPLTSDEYLLAAPYFEGKINLRKVRVFDSMSNYLKRFATAYVGFNIVNYHNTIRPAIMIHELVHIWQYQNLGSAYIGRALLAQASKEGYNYGGVENLYKCMLEGMVLQDFNFEQQAEIIEDAYRVEYESDRRGTPFTLSVYRYYLSHL